MKKNNNKSKLITKMFIGTILVVLKIYLLFSLTGYLFLFVYPSYKVHKIFNKFKFEINKMPNKQIKELKIDGNGDWDPYIVDITVIINNEYLLYFSVLGLEYDFIEHNSSIWLDKIEKIDNGKIYEIDFKISNFYNNNSVVKYKNIEFLFQSNYNNFYCFIKKSEEIIDDIFHGINKIENRP